MARGSIRPRQRTGGVSWEVRVDVGKDPVTGARLQESRWFPTKAEAERGRTLWLAEIARGVAVRRSGMTVAELLDYWLSVSVCDRLKEKTVADYTWLCRKHITPLLGDIPIQRVTAPRLQAFYARKSSEGLGPRTIQLCHLCLHQAFALAAKQEMVSRNVTDFVDVPRVPKREVRAWSSEQAVAFASVAHHSRYGPLWLLALATGMRRGELLGLRWSDVHLEAGTLQVRQTLQAINGQMRFGTPKTASGLRTVDLDDPLPALLRAHRAQQAQARVAAGLPAPVHNLVFTTPIGTPIHPDNVRHDFKRLCTLADVSVIPIHGQRHTFVSIALSEGADLKAVSESIGHADVRITMDKYQHVQPRQRKAVARAVSRVLFGDHAPEPPPGAP